MGCISSKHAVSASPDFDISEAIDNGGSVISASSSKHQHRGPSARPFAKKTKKVTKEEKKGNDKEYVKKKNRVVDEVPPNNNGALQFQTSKSNKQGTPLDHNDNDKTTSSAFSVRFGNLHKVEAEHVAAGWPSWLSAAAGEAIHGWLPLRAESFEKLEKIGQGTYSTVYRAREVETGRIFALKKVRFDNFQPESVRFMSREITILRRLDHPNIMKLEGIITSRLSCNMYLVFEYMEHDLAGLVSSPDIKFSVAQVKCYMQQLLSAIEHCHLLGVMHRDIKSSNILVNNEGVLKVADFGLANVLRPKHKQILTSRVVTLWYRPPELILGSTSYGVSVDLWSVGCVFAELLIGKPLFKGRTEVEQLHKIFRLCGSPPEEYWKKSKFPHASMFKPQHPYESTLQEKFGDFSEDAQDLVETLLSVEPHKRGTASSALMSEYFKTKPFACEPSSLPKYPPNKEIDAKYREEARRKSAGIGTRGSGVSRKPRRSRYSQELNSTTKFAATESNTQYSLRKSGSGSAQFSKGNGGGFGYGDSEKPSFETSSQISQVSDVSRGDFLFQVPKQVTAPCSFAWAGKRKKEHTAPQPPPPPPTTYSRSSSKYSAVEILGIVYENSALEFQEQEPHEVSGEAKPVLRKQRIQFDSFDTCELYHSKGFVHGVQQADLATMNDVSMKDDDPEGEGNVFSGPLLSQPHEVEGLLQRRDSQIRQATQIPWLQKLYED